MLYGKCQKVLKAVSYFCERKEETSVFDIGVYLHNRIQTEDLIGCLHQLKEDGYEEIIDCYADSWAKISAVTEKISVVTEK